MPQVLPDVLRRLAVHALVRLPGEKRPVHDRLAGLAPEGAQGQAVLLELVEPLGVGFGVGNGGGVFVIAVMPPPLPIGLYVILTSFAAS